MWGSSFSCHKHTGGCRTVFEVKEQKVIAVPNQFLPGQRTFYHYFAKCPKCGNLIDIPEYLIPDSVKERIQERSKAKDLEHLFEKKYPEESPVPVFKKTW